MSEIDLTLLLEELKQQRPLFPAPGFRVLVCTVFKDSKGRSPWLSAQEYAVVGFERDEKGELRLAVWDSNNNSTWYVPAEGPGEDKDAYGTAYWVFDPTNRKSFDDWKKDIVDDEKKFIASITEAA